MTQLYPLLRAGCLALLFLLLWSPARAQACYPDFHVYQVSPYGPLCSPGYVTLRADSYQGESGQYVSGEFRWYSSETSPWPVQTTQIWGSMTTSDYMLYAQDGTTVWVSYFDNNTWCESRRVSYTFSITPPPALSVVHARSCEPGTADIKLSGAPSHGSYRLYKYQNGYLNLVQNNSTGQFTIQGYDRSRDHSLYHAQIYVPSGCGNTVYYPLYIDSPDSAPPVVSGPLTVCQGNSTVLSATGGENSYTFRWYDGDGTQLLDGTQFTVPPTLAAGTHYYSVRGVSAAGCTTQPRVFDVKVNPRPVDSSILANGQAGATTIYLGQSVKISSSGGVGTPYYWCSSDGGQTWNVFEGAYGGQTDFSHTPTTLGTYRYHVRNHTVCGFCWDNAGTCPQWEAVDVTVQAPPTVHVAASSGAGIGFGSSLRASMSDGSEATFTWLPAVGLNSTAGAVIKANPVTTTIYTVTANGNGYTSTGTVTVSPGGNNHNYVVESVMLDGYKTVEELYQLPASEFRQQVSYFDGLGRASQAVSQHASPGGDDIVQPVEYDPLGREARRFLPYTAGESSGFFKPDALGGAPTQAGTNYLSGSYTGSQQYKFYQQDNANVAESPFSQAVFESSPLNRVLEQGAPGNAWQPTASGLQMAGHTVKVTQRANAAQEVRLWEVLQDGGGEVIYTTRDYYQAGTLALTESYDEQDALSVEYRDLQGRVVMKKVQESAAVVGTKDDGFLVTQYLYDDFGNLRLVIQPEGYRRELPGPETATGRITLSATLTPTFLDRWCFRYAYDGRRRLIEKQVPGAGPVRMVYNRRDEVILTQDAEQAAEHAEIPKRWAFTKYDALGRPVMTGVVHDARDRQALQVATDAAVQQFETRGNTEIGYTLNASSPTDIVVEKADLLTVTYYDDYSHRPLTGYGFASSHLGAASNNDKVKGLVTGTRTRVLGVEDSQGDPVWLTTVNFYDGKYRVFQTLSDGYVGGRWVARWERSGTVYDFVGQPEEILTAYALPAIGTTPARSHSVYQKLTYDHAGRHTATVQTIDGVGPEVLAENVYNELGQLVAKKLHKENGGSGAEWEQDFLQKVDFRYNIRGWLTSINDHTLAGQEGDPHGDLFGMRLSYNNEPQLGVGAQFNGNIAEVLWKTTGDGVQRGYAYAYDRASRLTGGFYRSKAGAVWTDQEENYTVSGISYDANGNIGSLVRHGLTAGNPHDRTDSDRGWGEVDRLAYRYEGNRLVNVLDQVTTPGLDPQHAVDFREGTHTDVNALEYVYDANGNMLKDLNKAIDRVTYNHLNLIERVEITGKGYIRFVYTASGQKLRKEVYDTNEQLTGSTDYAGPFVYQDGTLAFAHTSEGRALYQPAADKAWRYEYHLKDHLGNLRVSFAEPTSSTEELTMEMMAAPQEEEAFGRVQETRHLDRGRARSGSHAALLGAGRNKPLGPGRRLSVRAGETVKAEVYGLYEEEVKSSRGLNLATWLLGAATAGVGSVAEFGNGRGKALPYIGAGIAVAPQVLQKEKGAPVAYIRYIAYDADSNYVDSGYQLLSRKANGSWERLELEYTAGQDGFVEVYLANESFEAAWFDDMSVQHAEPILVQENHYDPWGLNLVGIEKQGSPDHLFQYNGKERQTELGLNWMDFGWRNYDPQIGRWHVVDPLADNLHNLSLSTYNYTANNPINNIDPDGRDWYTNNETGYYTWYKGNEEREGYTYVGGKNSVLGEFESKINTILTKTFKIKGGLYSEGFTFDIVDKDKGGLLPVANENGKVAGNFLDEFINNTGPEFSVFLSDHPYTEEMKTERSVKESHRLIEEGKTEVKGQRTGVGSGFGWWGYISSFSMAEQFIGSYRLDVFTSQDGKSYNNIISDSKSRSSLFYNRDVGDKSRNQTSTMGTTYQFYIWKSPIKK